VILAVAAAVALFTDCVPARWYSGDPKSLALLDGGPVNCLLVEARHWTPALVAEGRRRGLRMLASTVTPQAKWAAGADALVVEGNAPATEAGLIPVLLLSPRAVAQPTHGMIGVSQGVWPGLRIEDETVAGPTAAPWVDTNFGYLRYLQSRFREPVWLATRPPAGKIIPGRRYQQALADAALAGAHWVIDPGESFAKRLLTGETEARSEWTELMNLARFIEGLPRVRELAPYSRLGVSVREQTGALVSGGVLDMIASQHIPFQVVKTGDGMDGYFDFADDSIVRFPKSSLNRVSLLPDDVGDLEPVYRRVHVIVGRTNFGLRVFNGAGQLSAPYALHGGGVMVLLVNYTDYPVEAVTLHVKGQWKKATLEAPGTKPRTLSMYPVKESTAIEIDSVPAFAAITVEH
jgi:hypothetical protein